MYAADDIAAMPLAEEHADFAATGACRHDIMIAAAY